MFGYNTFIIKEYFNWLKVYAVTIIWDKRAVSIEGNGIRITYG